MTYELDVDADIAFIQMVMVEKSENLGKGYGKSVVVDMLGQAQDAGITKLQGESISPSLRVILDKELGEPEIFGPDDYWEQGLGSITVEYDIPKKK